MKGVIGPLSFPYPFGKKEAKALENSLLVHLRGARFQSIHYILMIQ